MANATIPGGGGGGAPKTATYLLQTANAKLPNAQAMGALATGIVKNTTATGVQSIAAASDIIGALGTQVVNVVLAGPTSGGVALPAFRALVAADLPAGVGTVTSVGLSTNAAWLTVGSSPITSAGTITLNSTTGLAANQVLATPNGGTGVVGLRSLVAADIPSLPASQITTGQLALARGGTNADLSATGAANSFLKQSSSGAAITVGTIASADLTTALTTPPAIGGTTPAAGAFTTLNVSTSISSSSSVATVTNTGSGNFAFTVGNSGSGNANFGLAIDGVTKSTVGFNRASNYLGFLNQTYGSGNAFSLQINTDGSFSYHDGANGTRVYSISKDGLTTITLKDAASAVVSNAFIIDHTTSANPAVGFGTSIAFQGQSSTTVSQAMGRIRTTWTTATHATRKARVTFSAYDTAERDAIFIEASGSAPMISVFSVTTPIIQPTTAIASSTVVIGAGTPLTDASTFDGYTAAQVVKALRNLGWLA